MPQLTVDQIKAGLLHDDILARGMALSYFAYSRSRDLTIMPLAIEAIESFGKLMAFHHVSAIANLAQTEATLDWVVRQWTAHRHEDAFRKALAAVFTKADPSLVKPFEKLVFAQEMPRGFNKFDLLRRFKYHGLRDDELWLEMNTICADAQKLQGTCDWEDVLLTAKELGRRGDWVAERMMAILETELVGKAEEPENWIHPLCVAMAGEMRYAPALPRVIAKMHHNDMFLQEECQDALVKIGGDGVVEAIRHGYPTAEHHFQFTAIGVLHGVRTDATVPLLVELLANEEDSELREWLAPAILSQLSTEGNEAVRQQLLDDRVSSDVKRPLVSACTLMGHSLPELPQWREDLKRESERRAQAIAEFLPPASKPPASKLPASKPPASNAPSYKTSSSAASGVATPAPQMVGAKDLGRNVPCPCGSGKKFKFCCLKKPATI